ncbi:hypothetical protein LWI29_020396 [Acer saccharum]|uniref:Reverse transcriptase Ty1/copia-type domain-containing protein n=1 Tax=Acer saccharum TaxID=4024 RepID=A0AA39VIP2_ACESA|nr:hypothetical protein LWI29_020396 [Acer saccharum]
MRQREILVSFRTPQHPSLGTNHWGGASPLLARDIPKESLDQRYLRLNSIRSRDEIFPADEEDDFNYQLSHKTHHAPKVVHDQSAPRTPGHSRRLGFLSNKTHHAPKVVHDQSAPRTPGHSSRLGLLSKLTAARKEKAVLGSKKSWFPRWDPKHRWPQDAWRKKEIDLTIQKGNSQQSKKIQETDVQIQKEKPYIFCDENNNTKSQENNEPPQLSDTELENILPDVTVETENTALSPSENEEILTSSNESNSPSNRVSTSDDNHSQTPEHQFLHYLPDLSDKLTIDLNDSGAGNNEESIQVLINQLNSEFALKDLGELHYFLGLEVQYFPGGITLSQSKYTKDLLNRAKLLESSHFNTPMALKPQPTPQDSKPIEAKEYRSLVGAL